MPVINDLYFGNTDESASLSTFSVNVLASQWTSTAPYKNTVTIPTEYKDKTIFIYNLIPASGTSTTDEEKIAFSYITKTIVTSTTIEFTCDTHKPTIDLCIAMSGSANEALYAIKSMLGNADISRIGDGTLTGALNYIANRTSDIIVEVPTTGWIEDNGVFVTSISKPGILSSDNILYGLYDENDNPSAVQILAFKTVKNVKVNDNEVVIQCTSIPNSTFTIAVKGCAIVDTNQHGSYVVSMVDQVIPKASWVLNASTNQYEAKIYNDIIKDDTVVDVNFKDSSLDVITAAQILSYNDSYNGYVVLYTKNLPSADVICDYTVMGSGSGNFGLYGIVGDTSSLSTNHKLSIIGAINELNSKISNLEMSQDALDDIKLTLTYTDNTIHRVKITADELKEAWKKGLFKYNSVTQTWTNDSYNRIDFDSYEAISTKAFMTAFPVILYSVLDNMDFLGDRLTQSTHNSEKTVVLRENSSTGECQRYNSTEYTLGNGDISVNIDGVGTVPINDSTLYNAWINGDIKFSLDTWTSNDTVLRFNESKLVTEAAVMKAIPLVVKDLIADFTPEADDSTKSVSFDDEDIKSSFGGATTIVTRENTTTGVKKKYTTKEFAIGDDTFTVKLDEFDYEISMNDSCLSYAMKKGFFEFTEGEAGPEYSGINFSSKRIATEAGVMAALPLIMPSIGFESKIGGGKVSSNKNANAVITRHTDNDGNTTEYSSEAYIVGTDTITSNGTGTYKNNTLATEAGVMKAVANGIAWSTATNLNGLNDSIILPESFKEIKMVMVYTDTNTIIDTKILTKSDIDACNTLSGNTSLYTQMVVNGVSYTATIVEVNGTTYTVKKCEDNAVKTILYYR